MKRHPIDTARSWLVALPLLPVLLPAAGVAFVGYGLYRGGEIVAGLCLWAAEWMSDKVRTTGVGPYGFGALVYLERFDLPALLVALKADRPAAPTTRGVALALRWRWGNTSHDDTRLLLDGVPLPYTRREVRLRGPVALFRTWTEGGGE